MVTSGHMDVTHTSAARLTNPRARAEPIRDTMNKNRRDRKIEPA